MPVIVKFLTISPDKKRKSFSALPRVIGRGLVLRTIDLKRGLPPVGGGVDAHDVEFADALGIPDVYNMERGGWKSPETYRKLYRRVISNIDDENTAKLNAHFEKLHS